MVSKKNFQPNGRAQNPRTSRGRPTAYQKAFQQPQEGVAGRNIGMMFNASQIPDNPGYMDFNNPTPPTVGVQQQPQNPGHKKKNQKNKQKIKPQQQQQQQLQRNGNWNKNKNPQQVMNNNNRFGNGPQRRFNQGHPIANRGRRMMPPVGPGVLRGGPMPPMPPHMPPNVFQPPMIPPIPPMGRGPMPPMGGNPHFLRRGRGGPMPPIPPPIPPMMGPLPPRARRGPPRGLPPPPPPVPFAPAAGKIKKPNPKIIKKVVKGKSTIKTLKNLVNQYPVDKPWVTAEIREEHDKKVDIENRLKGNKDDELFAQFKTHRDKFVSMYEKAREEYLKKEAAAVKAKDDKDKQTNKTAAKDENKKEANATA